MSTSLEATTPSEPVDTTGRLDGASKLRIFTVLAVIVLFTEVAPMQFVMVSAALRQIAPTFPDQGANINWAIIIFGVIGAAASPLIGKMSDIWGKKRMFLLCGVLFLIGCALCAITSNWMIFLVGRGLQATAIATAVISPAPEPVTVTKPPPAVPVSSVAAIVFWALSSCSCIF